MPARATAAAARAAYRRPTEVVAEAPGAGARDRGAPARCCAGGEERASGAAGVRDGPRRLLGHPNSVARPSRRGCRPADSRSRRVARGGGSVEANGRARATRQSSRHDAAGAPSDSARSGRRVRQVAPDVPDVQPAREVAGAVRDVEVDPGDEARRRSPSRWRRAGRGRAARRRGPPCSGRGGGCGRAPRRRSARSGRGRSPPRPARCRSRTGRRRARRGGRGARACRGCRPGGGTGCRRPTRTPSA